MTYSDTKIAVRDDDVDVVALQQRITAEVWGTPGEFDADLVSWREVTLYELALALTAEPLAQSRSETAAALANLQQFAAAEMRCSQAFFEKFNDILAPFQTELAAFNAQSGN